MVERVVNIFSLKNYFSGKDEEISSGMSAAISTWGRLYKNSGKLSLASGICSETARLVTLELKSEISGSKRGDYLNGQYENVVKNLRRITELACAKGGVVLKPFVSDGRIVVSVIEAEDFLPLEFNSAGEITGAAFLDRVVSGNKVYTRVERHGFENGVYKIRNAAFVSPNYDTMGKSIPLGEVEAWRDIEPYVEAEGVEKPIFSYFRMPLANNIDSASPLGVAVFDKVIPLIEDAEEQYKRLLWEFESGERALYIDEAAVRRDRNGNPRLPDKRLYRLLNSGNDGLFEDWTPELRDGQIISGLNQILRRIEFGSGLAYGTLSDVNDADRTAEEFRASKQRSYTHICDIQKSLENALEALVFAMNTLADLYSLAPEGKYFVSYEFDDSIVADRTREFEEKMRLLEKGIMSPWEVRSWYFGEKETEAKSKVKGAENEEGRNQKDYPRNNGGTAQKVE